ncbi:MAG: PQQ-binding-like beta-propeller repeat protein, partial [Thermoplasmata archaeon]
TAGKRAKSAQELGELAKTSPEAVRPAIVPLIDNIKDSDENVRKSALEALCKIVEKKNAYVEDCIEPLIKYTSHPSPEIRKDAFLWIIEIGKAAKSKGTSFIKPLLDIAEGPDTGLSKASQIALERMGYNGFSYFETMRQFQKTLEFARASGADLTGIGRMVQLAKSKMYAGDIDMFNSIMGQARKNALDARKFTISWKLNLSGKVNCVAISSDGSFVVAGTENGKVYSISASKQTSQIFSAQNSINDIDILGNGKLIVIASADKNVYGIDASGKLLWTFRTGTVNKCVRIDSRGEVIGVGTSTTEFYLLGKKGNLISKKELPQGAVSSIDFTADNSHFAVTFSDPYVHLVTKEFAPIWKHMVGVCNCLDMSDDGKCIAAGGRGRCVYLLDNAGVEKWKYEVKGVVNAVHILPDGSFVFSGSDNGHINFFTKSGDLKWQCQLEAPVFDMDVSEEGIYVVAVYGEDGIALIENRSSLAGYPERFARILEDAKNSGVALHELVDMVDKARIAYNANNYREGFEIANQARSQVKTKWIRKALDVIEVVKTILTDAVKVGADISQAEALLLEAVSALEIEHYEEAITKALAAGEEAKHAIEARQILLVTKQKQCASESEVAILSSIAAINEAVEFGADVSRPQEILQAAVKAQKDGDHQTALALARESKEIAQTLKEKSREVIAASFETVRKFIDLGSFDNEQAKAIRNILNKAIMHYTKTEDHASLAKCYDYYAKFEDLQGRSAQAHALYLKATSAYFKAGQFEHVLMLLLNKIKREQAEPSVKKKIECIIQEAFLIYSDGRLILHNSRRIRPDMDGYTIGSMLTAIQNFVQESFQDLEAEALNELRYGVVKILIERGEFVILAVVISGEEYEEMRPAMRQVIRNIEIMYRHVLESWDGDVESLKEASKYLEELIQVSEEKTEEVKSLEDEVGEIAKALMSGKK